jgi:DNA-binding NarL/FixJ family response regulator
MESPMSKTKILMVDDHALVRQALCDRLARESALEVVGTASTADEAIVIAAEARPDIVLMDIDMPGMICFDAAQRIASNLPEVRLAFLSAFFHDSYIEQALKVRARGYLTKVEPLDTLVAAIHEIARGGVYFSDEVKSRLVLERDGVKLAGAGQTRASTLTKRELEVLRYIARGLSKKEIASTMHLSVKTIENHCNNLMSKLDIHDRVELTRFAIREGLAGV